MWAMWEDERHAENNFCLAHTQYHTSLNDMKVNKFLSASWDRLETSFSDDVADGSPFLFLGVILIRASKLTSFVMFTVCWWDLWRVSLMLSWWEEFTQDVTYGKVTKVCKQPLHSPLSCPSDQELTDCSSSISSRHVLHFWHSESAAHQPQQILTWNRIFCGDNRFTGEVPRPIERFIVKPSWQNDDSQRSQSAEK